MAEGEAGMRTGDCIMRDTESRTVEVVSSAGRLCPFLPSTLKRDPGHTSDQDGGGVGGRGLRPKPVGSDEKRKEAFR